MRLSKRQMRSPARTRSVTNTPMPWIELARSSVSTIIIGTLQPLGRARNESAQERLHGQGFHAVSGLEGRTATLRRVRSWPGEQALGQYRQWVESRPNRPLPVAPPLA